MWKEHKDVGRPVAAVFIADVSGSMLEIYTAENGQQYSRIEELKKSLISTKVDQLK